MLGSLRERLENGLNLHPTTNMYDRAFIYLLLISLALRLIWLDKPDGSLIFDERRA